MDHSSVGILLTLAALTAQQGGGGKMEAEALVAVAAAREAHRKGGIWRKLRAARLVGAWRKKYAS